MFTGLIEAVGTVADAERIEGGIRLTIDSALPLDEVVDGESIAVDGVCLTVAGRAGSGFVADVIVETLQCTTLGHRPVGSRVNLERALRVGDRLGGHLVQGHVDTTAPVLSVTRDGGEYRIKIGWNPTIERFVAFKGSVALNGVSLTVASVDPSGFEVALIPTTLRETALGDLEAGAPVNVEVDLLARYLDRLNPSADSPRSSPDE